MISISHGLTLNPINIHIYIPVTGCATRIAHACSSGRTHKRTPIDRAASVRIYIYICRYIYLPGGANRRGVECRRRVDDTEGATHGIPRGRTTTGRQSVTGVAGVLHVEYAKQGTEYGILFFFSLFCLKQSTGHTHTTHTTKTKACFVITCTLKMYVFTSYEQALVCLSNREMIDASRGRRLHRRMANNRLTTIFFSNYVGLIYSAI